MQLARAQRHIAPISLLKNSVFDARRLKSVRENPVVPPGLEFTIFHFPGAEAPGYWQTALRA
jgi:hypothetical protein